MVQDGEDKDGFQNDKREEFRLNSSRSTNCDLAHLMYWVTWLSVGLQTILTDKTPWNHVGKRFWKCYEDFAIQYECQSFGPQVD